MSLGQLRDWGRVPAARTPRQFVLDWARCFLKLAVVAVVLLWPTVSAAAVHHHPERPYWLTVVPTPVPAATAARAVR